MFTSLRRPSHIVPMVMEEEMLVSRICSSCSTSVSLMWGLEGKLIDLWWKAISDLKAFLCIVLGERRRGRATFGLMCLPFCWGLFIHQKCTSNSLWLVDMKNHAITSPRFCLLGLEIWRQHRDSNSKVFSCKVHFLVCPLTSRWANTSSCSNNWQQESAVW